MSSMTHPQEYFSTPEHFYLNDYMSLKASADMQRLRLFPNAKEITESNAAFWAIKRHIPELQQSDKNIDLFSVGDGKTPRTSALFAFRSRWNCHSVDPVLDNGSYPVERLNLYRDKIENLKFNVKTAVIVAVHSHATLQNILKAITAETIFIVAIPCCINLVLTCKPNKEYQDIGIWSPQNTIKIWKLNQELKQLTIFE